MSAPGALHSAGAGECRRAMCCTHVGVSSEYQHRPGRWLSKEGRSCLESGGGWRMLDGSREQWCSCGIDRPAARQSHFPSPTPSPMERPSAPVRPCQRRPCFNSAAWLAHAACLCLALPALLSPSPSCQPVSSSPAPCTGPSRGCIVSD
jgi:hypothetical protein